MTCVSSRVAQGRREELRNTGAAMKLELRPSGGTTCVMTHFPWQIVENDQATGYSNSRAITKGSIDRCAMASLIQASR